MTKLLYVSFLFFSSNYLNAQAIEWQKVTREHKTIDNITYFFNAEVPLIEREKLILLYVNNL